MKYVSLLDCQASTLE